MNTLRNTVWEKKLPRFSGLVLVIALLAVITTMTSNVVLFSTKAAAGAIPKKVQITNISDTSFTVTYQTDEPVLGSIGFGKDTTLGSISLDDRDQVINKAVAHRLHYITIKNLLPGSKYQFEIASGGDKFKDNNEYFQVTTAPPLPAQATTQKSVTGRVALDDGAIPVEGIVLVGTDSSQTLSALLKPDGSYEVQLNQLRSSDLSAKLPITDETQLHVTVYDPTQQSTATIVASQVNPVPLMTLSKNYDFSINTSLADAVPASESAITPAEFPIPADANQVSSPIISIPTDQQSFTDQQPLFTGKSIPNSSVAIVIQSSSEITATVQSDESGNWELRPETPLPAGAHTLTIKSLDAKGVMQSVSKSFTVFAAGSQFVEPSISPPVIPTPVLAPSIPASASPTIELLPTPTVTIEPTPTVIVSTPMPVPTSTNTGANGGTTPSTGSSDWIFGIAGIIFTAGAGALLFFFI
jgi:hypothetical protein